MENGEETKLGHTILADVLSVKQSEVMIKQRTKVNFDSTWGNYGFRWVFFVIVVWHVALIRLISLWLQ